MRSQMKRQGPAPPRHNGGSSSGSSQTPRPGAPWELAAGGELPVEGSLYATGEFLAGKPNPISSTVLRRVALDKIVHHLTLTCSSPRDRAQRLDVVGA